MSENFDNFVKWFKEPITELHKNTDAGFIILMVSLPLLERYLRYDTGVCEKTNLDERFYKAFVDLFPSTGNTKAAQKFWETYRHGLLDQATLKTAAGLSQSENGKAEIAA